VYNISKESNSPEAQSSSLDVNNVFKLSISSGARMTPAKKHRVRMSA